LSEVEFRKAELRQIAKKRQEKRQERRTERRHDSSGRQCLSADTLHDELLFSITCDLHSEQGCAYRRTRFNRLFLGPCLVL
jgi:hypothetical protein